MDMMDFLCFYKLHRRHGSLRKGLQVKTPLQASQKWYQIEPALFKITPHEFENKLLHLQLNITGLHQQCCENRQLIQ
jgi:hypothetical protein